MAGLALFGCAGGVDGRQETDAGTSSLGSSGTGASSGVTSTASASGEATAADGDSTRAGADTTTGSSSTGDAAPSIPPAADPGPPDFPEVIDILTVAVRTADQDNAGTDANQIFVCLADSTCRQLNLVGIDDFRRGEIDVYHFEGLGLPRAAVDRVEIRSENGTDAWRPACLELRFDGEPVYCEEAIDAWIGTDPSDTSVWTDPAGLHEACTTCYDSTLTHGPMLAPAEPDAFGLWVRTEATRPVGLKMGLGPDLSDAPVVAWAYPRPQDDFTAVLEVPQVPAGLDWYYDVEIEGQPAMLEAAPVQTAPAIGTPVQTSFAFGSCGREVDQPIFEAIAAEGVDFFGFVGDNHYANSNNLQTVRWFYRRSRKIDLRRQFMATTPVFATWDDHDFVGNNTNGLDPLKDNSLQAFTEYWANRAYGEAGTPGVFSRWDYGDLEFFLLDDRYYRDVEAGSMLGSAQRAWLLDALEESQATFKFVVSGSIFSEFGSGDSWAAYLSERDEIFTAIGDANIGGVVLMSGDIHRSVIRWIDSDAGYPLLELTSSPLAIASPGNCANSPQAQTCYPGNSYIRVDVDTTVDDPTLIATMHDEAGAMLFTLQTTRSELEP